MATVMVVEDVAFIRMMLKEILEEAGHIVVTQAVNGLEAVEKFKAFRPDVVTMDISMPIMAGIQALREIKKIDPAAKVIMCSAIGQNEAILEAIRFGALDYVVKPVRADRLQEAVDKITTVTQLRA